MGQMLPDVQCKEQGGEKINSLHSDAELQNYFFFFLKNEKGKLSKCLQK